MTLDPRGGSMPIDVSWGVQSHSLSSLSSGWFAHFIILGMLHPALGGLSSVGIFGPHWPAVLVAAVSLAVVPVVAVSLAAVLVAAVSLAAVLVVAVSLAAVLVAAVSCSAVLVAAVSLAVVLVAAVSCSEVLVAAVSMAAVLVAAVSLAVVLVAAVSFAAVLVAAVSLAVVLVAVLSAVQVFPDLPVLLCRFPTLDGGAASSTLPTVPLGAALVEDYFPLSRRALPNF
ncbi:hypothetical protein NDU88_002507 [Pleurodeles waltl]|uniref:ABC transmembrane type-1 domain-containing protein n=1 Tax=Pleurodeles waltl TaxID=8319 RepID=A0AAV7RDK3_PLEWA|nr:hypothetical protein NDU88_002507 [Pleurodeles waltl]